MALKITSPLLKYTGIGAPAPAIPVYFNFGEVDLRAIIYINILQGALNPLPPIYKYTGSINLQNKLYGKGSANHFPPYINILGALISAGFYQDLQANR